MSQQSFWCNCCPVSCVILRKNQEKPDGAVLPEASFSVDEKATGGGAGEDYYAEVWAFFLLLKILGLLDLKVNTVPSLIFRKNMWNGEEREREQLSVHDLVKELCVHQLTHDNKVFMWIQLQYVT